LSENRRKMAGRNCMQAVFLELTLFDVTVGEMMKTSQKWLESLTQLLAVRLLMSFSEIKKSEENE
jgi:hypothetical protein